MGSEPAAIAASGTMAAGLFMATATAHSGQPQDHRDHGQLAHRERRIGLLEEQVEVAELLERLGQHAGRVVQAAGPGRCCP